MNDYAKTALKAAAVSAAGVGVIGVIGMLLDVSMLAESFGGDPMEIPVAFAVAQAAIITIIGAFGARAFFRRSTRPVAAFRILAWVVFAMISLSAILGTDDTGTLTVLLLMHVAVLGPTLLWLVPTVGDA